MSSRVAHFSSDDVDHLSNGFGKMGRAFKSSRGTNHDGFICTSQNRWDDDNKSDDEELKEEDVWGTAASHNHSYDVKTHSSSVYPGATENGGSTKGKGRKSWLSMELLAVGKTGQKKEHVGVGFAVLETVQNGGKESNGGWAPGFCTRKVKIPPIGGGAGGSEYDNGWYKQDAVGKHTGVPQSAPVSISVWPAKCGYGESNGEADVDDSDGGNDDDHEDNDEIDDEDDERGRRLAPHEIVDREYARSQSTTFSVIEGAGRTLKGMDLRRVRNAVWSCTGFED